MRKIIVTISLTAVSYIAIAQEAFPRFQAKPVTVGVTAAGDSIIGRSIDLSPFKVADYTYDSSTQRLYLDMIVTKINGNWDNRNYYTCYDLKTKKVLWNSSFKNYSPSAFFIGDNVARHMGAYCGVYDVQTRELLGKDPEDWIVYVDREHKFFLSQNGMAMDGTTLEELWDADINAKYGWSEIRYLGRDTIIIVADGLYVIDVKSGKGWQHQLKTGTDKYGNMVALNAIGLTAAVFTGVGVYGGSPDKFSGMCSNLLTVEDGWYLAGANAVIKVSRSGQEDWKVPLPEKHSGTSEIWVQGDSLFVLNKGYARKAGKIMPVDKPYLAAYAGRDGKLLYNVPIDDKGIVNSMIVKDGMLYLRFEKSIGVYDVNSGRAIAAVKTPDTMAQYGTWLSDSDIAVRGGNNDVVKYSDLKKREVLLQNTSNGNVMLLNNKLEAVGTMEWGDYYLTGHRPGYTYQITKGGTLMYEGPVVTGEIKPGFSPSFKHGNEFVTVDEDKLYFYTIKR